MKKNRNHMPVLQRPLEVRRPEVRIEFPKHGEIITSSDYAVHVSTLGEPAKVDIAIDQGDWQPCREALGLWWFDWTGYDAGPHQLIVRLKKADGDVVLSDPREVFVRVP